MSTLLDDIRQASAQALALGALKPIATHVVPYVEEGMVYSVRVLENLQLKRDSDRQQKEREKRGEIVNPFLPYEQDMFVRNLSDTHVCLLNKFNVVDSHILMVTRHYEEQDTLLTVADFAAMWQCLHEIDGLCFYNSGPLAGASQRHKHLQLMPLACFGQQRQLPVSPWINSRLLTKNAFSTADYPCDNTLVNLQDYVKLSVDLAAQYSYQHYMKMMTQLRLMDNDNSGRCLPYNVLATRDWMLIVPRTQERCGDIPVNALVFAGALLIRSEDQLSILRHHTVRGFLKAVGRHANAI